MTPQETPDTKLLVGFEGLTKSVLIIPKFLRFTHFSFPSPTKLQIRSEVLTKPTQLQLSQRFWDFINLGSLKSSET